MLKWDRRHQGESLACPERHYAMKGGETMQDRDIHFAILIVMILQLTVEIITLVSSAR